MSFAIVGKELILEYSKICTEIVRYKPIIISYHKRMRGWKALDWMWAWLGIWWFGVMGWSMFAFNKLPQLALRGSGCLLVWELWSKLNKFPHPYPWVHLEDSKRKVHGFSYRYKWFDGCILFLFDLNFSFWTTSAIIDASFGYFIRGVSLVCSISTLFDRNFAFKYFHNFVVFFNHILVHFEHHMCSCYNDCPACCMSRTTFCLNK